MTPEERRKAHLDLAVYDDQIEAEIFYNRLLAHFDVYEPAVADAIRYGLKSHPQAPFIKLPWPLVVDYPPGHPKA